MTLCGQISAIVLHKLIVNIDAAHDNNIIGNILHKQSYGATYNEKSQGISNDITV